MKDSVMFLSRSNALKWLDEMIIDEIDVSGMAFISVSDTHDEQQEIEIMLSEYKGPSLTLTFDDNDVGMSDEQAGCLLKFINNNSGCMFTVHCFAGVSRSGAIAKFINEHLGLGNWYLEDYMGHNRVVFNQLHKAAGTSLISYYEELERKDRHD